MGYFFIILKPFYAVKYFCINNIVRGKYNMARKMTNFNIDKSMNTISKPSVFDRIIKEVEANNIPTTYIDHILVQYHNGSIVELKGDEIEFPIPVNKNPNGNDLENMFRTMKDVKIFLNTNKLEEDINKLVEKLLGNYC